MKNLYALGFAVLTFGIGVWFCFVLSLSPGTVPRMTAPWMILSVVVGLPGCLALLYERLYAKKDHEGTGRFFVWLFASLSVVVGLVGVLNELMPVSIRSSEAGPFFVGGLLTAATAVCFITGATTVLWINKRSAI